MTEHLRWSVIGTGDKLKFKQILFDFEGPEKGLLKTLCGGLAQLGEHLLCKQGVKGSIPLISTTWANSSAG